MGTPFNSVPQTCKGTYLSHAIIDGEGSLDPMLSLSQKFAPVGYFFLPLYLKPLLSTEFLVVHI